jgi:shikimate dehydrogenase
LPRFGLIGRTLAHSFSPAIHSRIGDYEYRLYPLEPDGLADFVRNTDLDGFNVTIPYKTDVIPLCRSLTERAKAIGSVNTMLRLPDGGFLGDNTDYAGFLYLLGSDAEALRGQKALVLGSGGAARTVCTALADCGIAAVVVSRHGEDNYENLSRHADAALIVNTTPVGMYPHNGEAAVDLRDFPACRLVLDLIYNPARTALLLQAEALGISARNGLAMLAAQGVEAGERFLGRKLPPELPREITAAIGRQSENVILIGMPGCGKTTVAARLSELTGRPVFDTDELVYTRAGMPIPEIFEKFGEAGFRRLETEVLREVTKESGKIIATGGGVVTVPENRALLRQNGVCLFLDRDKNDLPTAGRPLSESVGTDRLLEARLPLYRAWSDGIYRNDDPLLTARRIKEDLKL